MVAELSYERLRHTCDPMVVSCHASDELQPLEAIIGQDRAIRSLNFGLSIEELGFNIYVSGMTGTGRTTAVRRFLEDVAKDRPVPHDLCYVNNFHDPYRPKALCLPSGQAVVLQKDVKDLVESVRKEIRAAFESDEYAAQREETTRSFQKQRSETFGQLNERARKQNLVIQATPVGLLTIPLKEGKPLGEEEFLALSPEEQQQINEKREALQTEIKAVMRQVRGLERAAAEALEKLDREVAIYAVSGLIDDLKEKYHERSMVVAFLDEMQEDILDNLVQFRGEETQPQRQPVAAPMPGAGDMAFRKYGVNVLVDNSELEGAPVVTELNPTYFNLFGRIEKEARFGALVTDFTMIREGSLHRANGGYLVLPVAELLRDPLSWDSLKRSLRNRDIRIEEAGERLGFLTAKSLRPEPCPLHIKVLLIGPPNLYQLLYTADEDFSELFKVKADFDTVMDCTEENIGYYTAFVCTLSYRENLKHLDRSALLKMVEYGSRLADDQEKLSTRFSEIADVIREANFYARQDEEPYITGTHVKKAIEEKFYRSSLIAEKVREMIERGTIMIDVAGEEIGQVNGLSVLSLGDITFGRPSRITVTTALGNKGLIDIERVARLGGPIHTKGVMILSGYLASKYARDKPLSLSARLVFEQSYSGVEGDSASSTELYAILSSLSGLPIRQSIAVTGSVNQKGEVQAIGGVNQKIEGFFQVCKAKGLTGEQGVLIPESNVRNLALKDEVVEAVQEEQFHIWPVKTIDEGIEALTGVEAGHMREDGTFEPGTVNDLVNQRLSHMAEVLRRYTGSESAPAEGEEPYP